MEEEEVLQPIDRNYLTEWEAEVCQIAIADICRLSSLWQKLGLLTEAICSVCTVISWKTATTLKCSPLVAYTKTILVFNFNKKHRTSLIQGRHSLVEFLSVKTNKRKCMKEVSIRLLWKSVHGYSSSEVSDERNPIQVRSGADGIDRKLCILHKSIAIVLDDHVSSHRAKLVLGQRTFYGYTIFPFLRVLCAISSRDARNWYSTRRDYAKSKYILFRHSLWYISTFV